jgi:hypothetical protein
VQFGRHGGGPTRQDLRFDEYGNEFDLSGSFCHFDIYRKEDEMQFVTSLIEALLAALTARPPAPCCASAIHWAGFR